VWPKSRDLLLNFGTLFIFGTAKATNLKFDVQITIQKCKIRG